MASVAPTRYDPSQTGGYGMAARDELEPIEKASVDELRALQLVRLKDTLRRAYDRMPHYKAKFDAAGVHPDNLKSLDDLAGFPFTTKDDLRQNYPFAMFAVPMNEIVRIHASSGTTGKPTVVGYTRGDIEIWAQVMARSIRAAGGRAGDIFHCANTYGMFTGGLGMHYGAEYLGCATIPMSGGNTERQVHAIRDFRPQLIASTPSYMLVIADEFERQGYSARDCSLRAGLFGGEPWSDGMRAEIEQRLGMHALDCYGLSEIMGPGVGMECVETKDGPTIWEDHFLPEIVDPQTGLPVADGETGELVFTTLTKTGLPMIRYRTRDLTRLLPGTARTMRRIDRIKGRSDDMLIIRGVNVFPSQIEAALTQEPHFAPHYVLELHRKDRLDELDVEIEIRPEYAGSLTAEARHALERKAEHLIKAYVGVTATARVVEPETIERSQGKARRVRDLRPRS